MEREMTLFEEPGPDNTEETLRAARRRAEQLELEHTVFATSTGESALKAAEVFDGSGIQLIGVTLHAGLWDIYDRPEPDAVREAMDRGVQFLTATHTLMGNVEAAIREKFGGLPPVELIAHTYYTFSQGMKVAVEVAVGAADAGLIPTDNEVIAMGGTNRGLDTAIVLSPAYSTSFFQTSVREIIAMPR